MRVILIILVSQLVSLCSVAQSTGIVKGVIVDTLLHQSIESATVSLLEKKDSSLVSFSITDNAGRFEFKDIRNGEYRLLVTHVNYRSSNTILSVNANNKIADLGNITMNHKSKTMDEVILQSEAPPVTLIDDTVQYNAGSFKTAPNANVEQLLKKLPGVKVEKDGTIKAQGETVNRVLVDGKEFFGNDPKIATKNLPADAIDKVQVYDRQSDQAQLTGFDDGNYEKTINLKLKKDKKKGLFGNIGAGAGTDSRYDSKLSVNSFKGARQLSAIATANNINTQAFSLLDILNFTGELSRMKRNMSDNINFNFSEEDAAAYGMGSRSNGINKTISGGVNYNNIIGTKTDFQSNYFYSRVNPDIESHIQRQYFLPDSSYYYKQDAYADNLSNNYRLNLNALYQPDSSNSIRITPSFSYQETNNNSRNNYQTLNEAELLTNEGFSINKTKNAGFNFKNELIYRRKLNRPGRTLSFSLNSSINQSKGNGSIYSTNSFFNATSFLHRDTIDQSNNTKANLTAYTGRIVYTEPVLRRSMLEFSIGKSNTKNTSRKLTYDFNKINGKHDRLNSSLSNDFENEYGYTIAGIRMRTQKRKYSYSFGATWQQAALDGKVVSGTKDSLITKDFGNVLPNARFRYNFSKFKSLFVNYAASTNQPSISQLQPVPDNTDPLNIKAGNPDLKQEYIHTLQANLNLVSPYKNKNLFVLFAMQSTHNKIVNYDSIDSRGIKYSRPVNVNKVYNINSNISYGIPVRFLKAGLEISSRIGYYKGRQFINTVSNNIQTLSLAPSLRLDFNPTQKLNISLMASADYNNTKYSLQSAMNIKYASQDYGASVDWELPKRFFFSTDFNYTINGQRASGFNNNIALWNASLSKQVLKFNRGEIKLSALDLLKNNIGISRSSNQNYVEDSRVKTLRRYFLLSFTYSLSKTGMVEKGGMKVITR